MIGTDLRWSSIDGTDWVASSGDFRFSIKLDEVQFDTHTYSAYCIRSDADALDFLGAYDTINEAKAACQECVK